MHEMRGHPSVRQMFIRGQWISAQDGEGNPTDLSGGWTGLRRSQPWKGLRGRSGREGCAARAGWRLGRLDAAERGRLMMRIGDKVLENKEELAQLEAQDTGRPISTARNDIAVLARYFEFYGGAADKVHGQVIPFLNGYTVTVLREPHGVTGHIIPWNYPAQMLGRTLAPSLAMGNATVLKPAEDTNLSALKFAELAADKHRAEQGGGAPLDGRANSQDK